MLKPDIELLKTQLQERYPSLLKSNKRFWEKEFVPFVKKFLDSQIDKTIIHEEDSPFKVERCPKCNVMVTYGDKYCSNCGTNFEWR